MSRCIAENRFKSGHVENGSWHQGSATSATNSMVQDGCVYQEQFLIQHCFQVRIESGAKVSSCLVGKGAIVQSGAELRNVVVGHGVRVPAGHIQTEGTI